MKSNKSINLSSKWFLINFQSILKDKFADINIIERTRYFVDLD